MLYTQVYMYDAECRSHASADGSDRTALDCLLVSSSLSRGAIKVSTRYDTKASADVKRGTLRRKNTCVRNSLQHVGIRAALVSHVVQRQTMVVKCQPIASALFAEHCSIAVIVIARHYLPACHGTDTVLM